MGFIQNCIPEMYLEDGASKKLALHYSNYVYHQEDEFDMMQNDVGIVEDYDDWKGGEEHLGALSDEDYNRFTWLVEEGEAVCEGQHLATIKTRDEDYADDYWVILVANYDGFIHKEIKNGKHAMDSNEQSATIYECMSGYERAVLSTGKVKARDSLVKKCPGCGTLLNGAKKFCGECGTKLIAEEKVCASCGAKLAPGQKFCCECGTKAEQM